MKISVVGRECEHGCHSLAALPCWRHRQPARVCEVDAIVKVKRLLASQSKGKSREEEAWRLYEGVSRCPCNLLPSLARAVAVESCIVSPTFFPTGLSRIVGATSRATRGPSCLQIMGSVHCSGSRGSWPVESCWRYLQRYFGVSSPSSRPLTSLPGKSPLLPSRRRSRRSRRSTSRCNICLGALLALCLTRPLVSTCVGSAVLAATSCSSLAITAAIVKNDASSRWGLPSRHGAPIASILTSCAPSAPVIRA